MKTTILIKEQGTDPKPVAVLQRVPTLFDHAVIRREINARSKYRRDFSFIAEKSS